MNTDLIDGLVESKVKENKNDLNNYNYLGEDLPVFDIDEVEKIFRDIPVFVNNCNLLVVKGIITKRIVIVIEHLGMVLNRVSKVGIIDILYIDEVGIDPIDEEKNLTVLNVCSYYPYKIIMSLAEEYFLYLNHNVSGEVDDQIVIIVKEVHFSFVRLGLILVPVNIVVKVNININEPDITIINI